MMIKKITALLILLALSALDIPAQTNAVPSIMESTTLPQWVKDLRRWEIITFGSFPFAMLTATTAMDMYRWSKANGMDFSDTGRQYAPWPLKSAGAVAMESKEQELTITIAAGLSVLVACTDMIIVQVKRNKERKRVEALPVGTTIITKTPWQEGSQEEPVDNAPDERQAADPDLSPPAP